MALTRDVVIGLGSNLGARLANLRAAVDLLETIDELEVEARSRVYASDAVGPPQPGFLNAAVRVRTTLSPERLLDRTQRIEELLGRVRAERWGPRTIDLDILLWEDAAIRTDRLTVPHPRLPERPFAVVPALEVAPGVALPPGEGAAPAVAYGLDDIAVQRGEVLDVHAPTPLDAAAALAAAVLPTGDAPFQDLEAFESRVEGPEPVQGCFDRAVELSAQGIWAVATALTDEPGSLTLVVVGGRKSTVRSRAAPPPKVELAVAKGHVRARVPVSIPAI